MVSDVVVQHPRYGTYARVVLHRHGHGIFMEVRSPTKKTNKRNPFGLDILQQLESERNNYRYTKVNQTSCALRLSVERRELSWLR